jgi:hypothetical protein
MQKVVQLATKKSIFLISTFGAFSAFTLTYIFLASVPLINNYLDVYIAHNFEDEFFKGVSIAGGCLCLYFLFKVRCYIAIVSDTQ